MFYEIEGIKDNFDLYGLDYVNCIERPIAIYYKYIKKDSERLYLMKEKSENLIAPLDFGQIERALANYENETGVRCNKIYAKENLEEVTRNLIRKGNPVLVIGNLRELYYSPHYKEKDWNHMFLITGFDEEKNIFSMLDYCQFIEMNEKPCYQRFIMRAEDLNNVFNAEYEANRGYVHYLELAEDSDNEKKRILEALNSVYKSFKTESDHEIQLKILEIINKHYNLKKEKILENMIEIQALIMNSYKMKTVILEQLIKYLKSKGYEYSEMEKVFQDVAESWKNESLSIVKSLMRKKLDDIQYLKEESTKKQEEKLLETIKSCIEMIEGIEKQKTCEENRNYRNNQDEIITVRNGQYHFDFHTGKLYNSWIDDECPKVVLYGAEPTQNLNIQAKCVIDEDFDREGHQEGIYIVNKKGDLYTFGIDFEKKFIVDLVGKVTLDVMKSNEVFKTITFKVTFSYGVLTVGIIKENGEFTKFESYELGTDFEVAEAGVFCKTWNACKQLKVTFSNTKVY